MNKPSTTLPEIKDSPAMDLMSGPIPGSSLTVSPGSRPYEQPPKYVNEDDALYAMLDSFTDPDNGASVGALLDKGVYAADIANSILLGGVAQGKWTPDLAALMAKKTLGMVVATGHAQGIKDIRCMRPKESSYSRIKDVPSMRGKSMNTEGVI